MKNTLAVACVAAAAATATTATAWASSAGVVVESSNSIPFVVNHQRLLSELRGGGGDNTASATNNATTSSSTDDEPTTPQPKKRKPSKKKAKKKKKKTDQEDDEAKEESSSRRRNKKQDPLIEQLLKEEEYYAILGVDRDATPSQIKKAYRRRAVQTHPDKLPDGDRRAFDKVSEAYQVLSDDEKRPIYNRYGKRGLESGAGIGGGSSVAEDIFKSFFGSQFQSSSSSSSSSHQSYRTPRNRTVRYQLEVSLEDLYRGMKRTILVEQPGKEGPKRVEVDVPRGMATGETVVLSGEMDAIPGATPGDLVFVLAQQNHPVFTRRGHDLAMELEISLQEAVCGVAQREIRHLDGRTVLIASARTSQDHKNHKSNKKDNNNNNDTSPPPPPLLIHSGDIHVLRGEGMPKRESHLGGGGVGPGEQDAFGDLYVQYKVQMPSAESLKNLNEDERYQLDVLLRKLEGNKNPAPRPKQQDGNNNANENEDTEEEEEEEEKEKPRQMLPASLSDFGRASGPFRPQREGAEDEQRYQGGHFGGGSRQFFWSSTGSRYSENDDGNVQCQQM